MHGTRAEDAADNSSTMMITEAPTSTAVSFMTDSRVEGDTGITQHSTAAADGKAAGGMMSSEAQQSDENLSGAHSGATEGSMGTVSAADAGSVTLANGHVALDPAALASPTAGGNGGGEQLAWRDEDLRDAAEVDEDCEAFAFPGVPPLDDWSLTDEQAQLVLGAQVEQWVSSAWCQERCLHSICALLLSVHGDHCKYAGRLPRTGCCRFMFDHRTWQAMWECRS